MHQPHGASAAADGYFVAGIEFATIWPSALRMRRHGADGFDCSFADNGKIIERFDSACGQMGVSANTSAVGKTIAPPAASEYAVEPVGELMIKPSQR